MLTFHQCFYFFMQERPKNLEITTGLNIHMIGHEISFLNIDYRGRIFLQNSWRELRTHAFMFVRCKDLTR